MLVSGRRAGSALLLAALVAIPAVAGAQQAACSIDEGQPAELARATLALTMAGGPRANKALSDAVKSVGEQGARIANQPGRNLMLAKLLLAWHQQPGITPAVTRGDIGYTTDKNAPIDLLAAADSAFTAVERSNPECAAEIAQFRQSEAWRGLLQEAIAAHGRGQLDSAAKLAQRSMVIDRNTPYPHQLLADIAQQRKDTSAALTHWRQVIRVAGADTLYDEPRQMAHLNIGDLLAGRAQAATGADSVTLAREAAQSYREYLKVASPETDASAARFRLAGMLSMAGDTAGIPSVYAPLIAEPGRFNDMHLVQAGVIAVRAGRNADAAKLFAAALERNPYDRDALTNLAASHYGEGEFAKMPALVDRLVALDPNNPDALTLYVYAYSGLSKAEKNQARRKALNDSVVAYSERADKMPAVLHVTQFARGSTRASLNGTIENRTDAPKSYRVSFEFLDKTGAVVATQEAVVEAVAPKASKPFTVMVPHGGIVAFRYKPLA